MLCVFPFFTINVQSFDLGLDDTDEFNVLNNPLLFSVLQQNIFKHVVIRAIILSRVIKGSEYTFDVFL